MDEFKYLATKSKKYSFEDLCLLAKLLRADGGCPWDKEQTHKSIRKDIIEETYEVIEAIDKEDSELMREELGDLLWQVVFHAELEREEGRADMSDIVHDICAKLVHRHPHVFGSVLAETSDVVLDNWEKIKTEEKQRNTVTSKLQSVPPALPALMRAQKIGKRAPFFDFADVDEVLVKLEEETNELKTAITSGDKADIDEEFGDLLFTAVSLARKLGIDAEESLTKASEKFIGRFAVLEAEVIAEDKDITALSMAELDAIWDRIKHQSNN
jgi:tetrapyrrole methylase family protein/MazG family protein